MKANRNVLAFHTIKNVRKIYDNTVENPAYLDLTTYFPEHKIIEQNWQVIYNEINQIIEQSAIPEFHDIDAGQAFISNNDKKAWNVFVLKLYGFWISKNAEKCPKTREIFKDWNHVKTINFSILAPGKYIPPHRGPYRGILRYQIALEVPRNGECYIIVGGKRHYWKAGQSVLFDDTYMHEVHNKTDERRIALLLDVKRRDFGLFMRAFDWLYYRLFQIVILVSGGLRRTKVY